MPSVSEEDWDTSTARRLKANGLQKLRGNLSICVNNSAAEKQEKAQHERGCRNKRSGPTVGRERYTAHPGSISKARALKRLGGATNSGVGTTSSRSFQKACNLILASSSGVLEL